MKFLLRNMTEEDLGEVATLENQLFSDAWTEEMFRSEINLHEAFIAVNPETNEILGFTCGWTILDEYSITNVGIKKSFRRRGIAFRMLKAVIEEKIKKGIKYFFLEVRESNFPAILLYEKLGFEKNGMRKNYYSSPAENAFLMSLRLLK
ncbi:MAG: ribosomal-protein-alanine N-acetyltransferase [Candidatus Cloacimonadota bacterium]|nr:MAG: ribosomal-protein-alanine N-acetyltransferase [Candidatus Cloacimonadota bacterium]